MICVGEKTAVSQANVQHLTCLAGVCSVTLFVHAGRATLPVDGWIDIAAKIR